LKLPRLLAGWDRKPLQFVAAWRYTRTRLGGWNPVGNIAPMQRFVAELTNLIDKAEFERSWQRDAVINPNFAVQFRFDGRKVSMMVENRSANHWQSDSFHQAFSAAIRRVDQNCSVRWL